MKYFLIFFLIYSSLYGQILNIENYRFYGVKEKFTGSLDFSFNLTKNNNVSFFYFNQNHHFQYSQKKKFKYKILTINQIQYVYSKEEEIFQGRYLYLGITTRDRRILLDADIQLQKINNYEYSFEAGPRIILHKKDSIFSYLGILNRIELGEFDRQVYFRTNYYLVITLYKKAYSNRISLYYQPLTNDYSKYRISFSNSFQWNISKSVNIGLLYVYYNQFPFEKEYYELNPNINWTF